MSVYGERFWKRHWDEGVTDLEPSEFDTTYVDMIRPVFEEKPDKTAFGYHHDMMSGSTHTMAILNPRRRKQVNAEKSYVGLDT